MRFGSNFRAFLPELFPGIEYLSTLSQQADWVKGTVEELNRDQKERLRDTFGLRLD